jgi:hypothetical protein
LDSRTKNDDDAYQAMLVSVVYVYEYANVQYRDLLVYLICRGEEYLPCRADRFHRRDNWKAEGELTESELVTIGLNTAQRVLRGPERVGQLRWGSREIFAVAQRAHSKLEM